MPNLKSQCLGAGTGNDCVSLLQKVLGVEVEVGEEVWDNFHHRNFALSLKAFLSDNFHAMQRGMFYNIGTAEADDDEISVQRRAGKFKQAENVHQAMRAISNMVACYRQVWPGSWAADVLGQ